jgi:SAM-dependent methyltransferase
MPSNFHVKNADVYEQLMGRFSSTLSPLLLAWLGLEKNAAQLLDVGCGTGSLIGELLQQFPAANITAMDYETQFVAHSAAKFAAHHRVTVMQGDAEALGFSDQQFDHTLSMLTVHFIANPVAALREMKRVTRRGGTVAATVWKAGGGGAQRLFWEVLDTIDPALAEKADQMKKSPMIHAQGLRDGFAEAGLAEVVLTELSIEMDFESFAQFWQPYGESDGKTNKFMQGLSPENRVRLKEALRVRYLDGGADGPRRFPAIALACRGVA